MSVMGTVHEQFNYRIHHWHKFVTVDYHTSTDFSRISKFSWLSEDHLREQWNLKEEDLIFEIVS